MQPFGDQGVAHLDPMTEFQGIPPTPRVLRQGRFRPGGVDIPSYWDESQWVKLNGEIVVAVPNGSSILVLPPPTEIRNYLGFRNNSTAGTDLLISYGGPASLNSWMRITVGTIILHDVRIPQDEIYAYADGPGGLIVCVQSMTPGNPI